MLNDKLRDMHAFNYMQPTPCTIGQVHLLVAEKPSVRLSDRHAGNSVIFAWIDVGLGLYRAVISGMCTHISISF